MYEKMGLVRMRIALGDMIWLIVSIVLHSL